VGEAGAILTGAAMPSAPSKDLQRVPNPHADRDYEVDHVVPEFTCVCPMTGQPDFATIRIRYVPDRWLVELKSLKLYMWAYRNEGAFHEDVTNRILSDLVRILAPRRMEVVGDWNVRGGIKTVVTVRYDRAATGRVRPIASAPRARGPRPASRP
jgi:7-cyano-7-deazaguanine reductase